MAKLAAIRAALGKVASKVLPLDEKIGMLLERVPIFPLDEKVKAFVARRRGNKTETEASPEGDASPSRNIADLMEAIDEAMWQLAQHDERKAWLVLRAAWLGEPLPFNERPGGTEQ